MILFAAMTLSSCDSDKGIDDDFPETVETPGGAEAIAAINPNRVFTTGLPAAVDGRKITLDSKGRVIGIGNATITYYENQSRGSGDYDGVLVYGDNKVSFCLNPQGLIKYIKSEDRFKSDIDEIEEFWINYNSDYRISEIKELDRDDDGNTVYYARFSYEKGNLTSVKVTEGKHTGMISVSYADLNNPDGVSNKGHYYFDPFVDIYEDYLYYAGLLGIGSDKLPLKVTDMDGDDTYIWTFDNEGYPKMAKIIESDGDIDLEYFNWK